MPTLVTIRCPECKADGEVRFEGIHSGLGPARYECRKCACAYESGRQEWPELSAAGRWRYAAISLLYVAVGALAGGAVGFFVGHAWRDPYFSRQPAGFHDAIVPAIVLALVVTLIQVARIPRSIARYQARKEACAISYRPGAIEAWGGHQIFLLTLVLFCGLGWVVAAITRGLGGQR